MPTHLASLDSLVHPHQMEVQEFSYYALVIDARSTRAYQEDHLPGAVSIPVSSEDGSGGSSDIRFGVGAEAIAFIAREASPKIPYALAAHLGKLRPGGTVLVYCDRGGLDSLVWAKPLRALGFTVDLLGGGWINYRRWVDAGLEVLPRALTFRRLVAPPVGGLCRVLDTLAKLGEQTLDLAALAGQRLVPGLTLPGDATPSQEAFESAVFNAMRGFSPQQPVWVRYGLNGLGNLEVPPPLRDALQRSQTLRLEVPLAVRADAWTERMQAMGIDMASVLQAISVSAAAPAAGVIEQWRSLASEGQVTGALTQIIEGFIDSPGQREELKGRLQVAKLVSLAIDAVAVEVDQWRKTGAWIAADSGGLA